MTEREQFEKWAKDGFMLAYSSARYRSQFTQRAWEAWQAARATPALPQAEHDLEDVRCQCCGYMTYHREHMGCIRSAYKQALPQVPEGMAIVPVDEITPEMWSAGRNEFCRIYDRVRYAMHSEIESAEIDAAPQSMMTAMLAAAKEKQS